MSNQYCIVEEVTRCGILGEPGCPYTGTGDVAGLEYNSVIKCRTMTDYNRAPDDAEVIVFASTFEEALSNNINGGGTN